MIRQQKPFLAQHLRRVAFTLMEMLVVVAIIVVLAGMGGYYFIGQLNDAKIDAAKVQCQTLNKAVQTFYIRHKNYPTSETQLFEEVDGREKVLDDPNSLKDPWGGTYHYDQQQHKFGFTNPKTQAISY